MLFRGRMIHPIERERTSRGEALKIRGGGSIKPVSPTGVQETVGGKPAAQNPVAPSRADKVQITSLSAHLQQLEKVLNDVGVVDAARVEAVKQAISEGRFTIDTEVVADQLLTSAREFLTPPKG
jgi:negative regulator of flagellin synthesis FlgM